MADQHGSFDFTAAEAKDIVEERQHEWARFTRFVAWGIGLTVLLLVLLLVFVA